MTRKGRKFEVEYQKYYQMLDKSIFQIESPGFLIDKVTGTKREIDVLIKYKDSSNIERLISIECRDRPNTIQDTTWIEQLITKKNDLGIDITIATTTNKFSGPAVKKANAYGLLVHEAEMINSKLFEELIKTQFFTASFIHTKVVDLSIVDKRGTFYSLKYIVENTSQVEKKIIETNLNENFIFTEKFYSLRGDFYNTGHKGIICKKDTLNLILDYKNNQSSIVFAKKIPIDKINFKIKLIPFNVYIPLIDGVFINNPNTQDVIGYRKEFENNFLYIEESKHDNDLIMSFEFKSKIDKYIKFIEYSSPPILKQMNYESGQISMMIKGLSSDSYLGELDFRSIWNV